MELAGVVGKPNVGKSTLFSALTLTEVEIANYPFTTKKTNVGVTYVRLDCVCKSVNVKCNPKNSRCIDGVRLVPIQIIDCPGIIPDAHKGKGLGLQFLDEIRQASALIVVADAAGGTAIDGTLVEPGTQNPVEDVEIVLKEFDIWLKEILLRDWPRISRAAEARQVELGAELGKKLTGLGVSELEVTEALTESGLDLRKPTSWSSDNLQLLATLIRIKTKPFVVAANKCDMVEAKEGLEKLRNAGYDVVPCSAEAERTLRLAASRGLIKYLPGDSDFEILDRQKLNRQQEKALERIRELVLTKYGGTGVQHVINRAYLEKLGYIPIYPVEDPHSLTDHSGNVLPDVYLVPRKTTPRQLAYMIHTELGEGYLYAVDAQTGMRLSEDEPLQPNQIISIASTKKRS